MASIPPPLKKPAVLQITKGARVQHNEREYIVLRLVDLSLVLAREVGSGEKVLLRLDSLNAPSRSPEQEHAVAREIALEEISEEAWALADYRLKILEPLLHGRSDRSRQDYAEAAAQANVGVSTVDSAHKVSQIPI
ncbi:hypothetical protein ACFIQG_19445 [Comamonas odontotermitis]|uniref:hypothetical protein n=1 Tax=Comamonas odontotermitis TaxID=379895 RepID=UPI00366FF51F